MWHSLAKLFVLNEPLQILPPLDLRKKVPFRLFNSPLHNLIGAITVLIAGLSYLKNYMNWRHKFFIIVQLKVDVLALDHKVFSHDFCFGVVDVNKFLNFLGRLGLLELFSFSWACHFFRLGLFWAQRNFLLGMVFERIFHVLRNLRLLFDVLGGLSKVIGSVLKRRNFVQVIFNELFIRLKGR